MKWFVLATLLLANVIYFGWELDRETKMKVQGVSTLNIPAAAKRLSLLSELNDLPELRESSADELDTDNNLLADLSGNRDGPVSIQGLVTDLPAMQVEEIDAGVREPSCFSFGPIPEELAANGLMDWFTSRGAFAQMRSAEEQARQLLWIYLAPQQSRKTALAVLDELKNKGISDYRLISHGSLQNAISLGLFSSQAAVNSRLRELQKKGYKPVVVPYANVRRIYWIDVELQVEEELLEQVFKGHPSRHSSVPINCSEIAMKSATS